MTRRHLLGVNSDAKTIKGLGGGFLTGILYLAPADLSGREVCPMRAVGCSEACLNTAGRGAMNSVQLARISKTNFYFDNRPEFLENLRLDIGALARKASRENLTPVVRLNGTSDIPWERVAPELFTEFSAIQFYDYTKRPRRETPTNYGLTFSRSEDNGVYCVSELGRGVNVAVVFSTPKGQPLPLFFMGYEVIDGDLSDARFTDTGNGPGPYIVGLRAKGKASRDTSGFVVDSATLNNWGNAPQLRAS